MKKKLFVSVLLMLTLTFTGCQKADVKSENTDKQNPKVETKAEKKDEKVEEKSEDKNSQDPQNPPVKFEAKDLDGNKVTDDIFKKNKVTVVNIWATSCGYCIKEMPDLEKVSQKYKDKKVAFYGIALDVTDQGKLAKETMDEARSILKDTKVTYPTIVPSEDILNLVNELSIAGVPVTLFINDKGVIEGGIQGMTDEETLSKVLDDLLKK